MHREPLGASIRRHVRARTTSAVGARRRDDCPVYAPDERDALADELADAFLDGRWRPEDLAERGAGRLDRWPEWMDALAFAAAALGRVAPVERRVELVTFIERFLDERPAGGDPASPPQIIRWIRPAPRALAAVHRDHGWPVAPIASVPELAELLELSLGQLAWLADVRGLERTVPAERLRNYRYRWTPRRSGLPRLIEAPKARLKEIQRRVLHEVLDRVPVHPAAHGFAPGRSVVTHATMHAGRRVVVGLDLRDFFASVSAGRVYGIFRSAGYGRAVAHALTGLCTNAAPASVWAAVRRPAEPWLVQPHFWLGRALATPHLPQGAPTSPALANLAAFALDRRLSGLGEAFALRYSRYADDLTFSGRGLSAGANRALVGQVAAIAAAEGFLVNPDKTRLRTAAQRQVVTGVVVNQRLNVPRDEYDRLRAVLHRLARHGQADYDPGRSVDLEAHLRGRVAWVAALHRGRGEKLARMLDGVDWTAVSERGGS